MNTFVPSNRSFDEIPSEWVIEVDNDLVDFDFI